MPSEATIRTLAPAVALLVLLAGSYLALGVQGIRASLRAALQAWTLPARVLAGPAVLLVGIVAYAALGQLPVARVATLYAAYVAVPALVLIAGATASERAPVAELLAVLALWLPIEFRLLPPLPVPPPHGFNAAKFVGLVAGLYFFLLACPVPGIGYTFRLSRRDVWTALTALALYAIIAIPIGLATGFLSWSPRLDIVRVAAAPVVTYLVVAVPEEFLFRGLIQNLLARSIGARWALAVASVVFGLAHFPDSRYMLLAAFAGLAYGWVYERTAKITASAITHALVDAVWVVLLRV
jgi:uncharacterized protein